MIDNDWNHTEPEANYQGWGSVPQIRCHSAVTVRVKFFEKDICLSYKCTGATREDEGGEGAVLWGRRAPSDFSEAELTRRLHQRHPEQQQWKPGPIRPTPVMFVSIVLNTRGLCLAVSEQIFVFEMQDSIVLPPGSPQPEWIPIYFLSPHPFSVKVGSIMFDGELK